MTSNVIYYCVYRITNLVENKHYYGYKSSKIHPSKVIGVTYFSSSTDKEFIKDQKENPKNYKYKIVQNFSNKKDALTREILLHNKFNVAINSNFYNRAKQTSIGFDCTGKFTAKDKEGNTFSADINDPRRLTGEIISVHVGNTRAENTIQAKDLNGKFIGNVSKCDSRWNTGEIIYVRTGCKQSEESKEKNKKSNQNKITIKTPSGEIFKVSSDDPLYLNGTYVGISSGMIWVNNNIERKTINAEELSYYLNNGWKRGKKLNNFNFCKLSAN